MKRVVGTTLAIVVSGAAVVIESHAEAVALGAAMTRNENKSNENKSIAPAAPQNPPVPPSTQPAPPSSPPAPSPTTPPKTEPGAPPSEKDPGSRPPAKGKTLDELLGIPPKEGEKKGATGPAAGQGAGSGAKAGGATGEDPAAVGKARQRVQRTLDEEEVESLLEEMLGDMQSSVDRLGSKADPGLETQRAQKGVVDKLDILIQQAQRKKQQKSSSSSSSSSSDSQRPQDNDQQKQDGSAQQNPTDAAARDHARNQRGESRPLDPPGPEDPTDEQKMLDETRSEWGALPARVRELIRQGSRDRVASLYERLTQEYYRRMAEDASK